MIFVAGNVGNADYKTFTKKNGENSTVLNFSVAENILDGKDESGKNKTRTNWYRVSIFGKYADAMQAHITKGKVVQVTGNLRVRQYETKDGGIGVELNIDNPNVSLLGGGKSDNNNSDNAAPAPAAAPVDEGFVNVPDGIEDEIPFA